MRKITNEENYRIMFNTAWNQSMKIQTFRVRVPIEMVYPVALSIVSQYSEEVKETSLSSLVGLVSVVQFGGVGITGAAVISKSAFKNVIMYLVLAKVP